MVTKRKFYAYLLPDGRQGVVDNLHACEKIVSGVKDMRFKGFALAAEAKAWLAAGASFGRKKSLEPGIYFDAGTGRGHGVEVSVTDEKGCSLLDKVLPKNQVNQFGKYGLYRDVSNNYGELLACSYALQIALKANIEKIYGDSKLVLDYWSKGCIKNGEVTSRNKSTNRPCGYRPPSYGDGRYQDVCQLHYPLRFGRRWGTEQELSSNDCRCFCSIFLWHISFC